MNKIFKPILYSPAGDINKGLSAFFFGADGVYIGLDKFGLRKNAKVDLEELKEFIDIAHKDGKKVDITLNAYLKNDEIQEVKEYIAKVIFLKPDSIIFSDPAVLLVYKELIENMPNSSKIEFLPTLTLSTQSNTTNFYSMKFWAHQGVKRIVAARELTLLEVYLAKKQAKEEKLNFELETFIHGAMCVSLSGRCLLSLYMTNKKFSKKGSEYQRDANRGECVHPCRFAYLVEQSRENEYFPIEEDGRYSYILSSKDLCLLYYIPLFIFCSIDAFKIEGRMKSSFYTSSITFAYRNAIDKAYEIFSDFEIKEKDLIKYLQNPSSFLYDFNQWKNFVDDINIYTDLASHRPYTTGFYFSQEHPDYMMPLYESKLIQPYSIVAEYIGNKLKKAKRRKGIKNASKTNLQENIENQISENIEENRLKPNQFIIFSKNSVKIEDSTFFLFCKKGIFDLKNFKIFDLNQNSISLIQHSKNYILELEDDILFLTELSKDQIFFIFCKNKIK